jgi:plastocyanin
MNPRTIPIHSRKAGAASAAKPLRRRSPGFLARLALTFAATVLCLTSQAQTNYIYIQSSAYNPDQLAINVGETVTWIHDDNTEHTVTSDDSLFNSGTMLFGDQFSYKFDTAGTYTYYCLFHGHGMAGAIVVAEATENNPPATPVNALPLNNASNQPVAVQLRAGPFSDPDASDFQAASQWIVRYANNQVVAVDSGAVTGASLTNYSPAGLAEGTAYDWQVRYKDGRGAWSEYSTPTRFTTLVSFNEPGIGLRASYNNLADFNSPLVVVTNAAVNFDWGHVRPNRRITADGFAVRWEGSLLPQFTTQYAIQLQYRGQARVWVNNQLLIDEWNGCSFSQTRRGLISLVAGQLAAVRVEYVADPAGALAILRWTSSNLPMEVVPTTRLFPYSP